MDVRACLIIMDNRIVLQALLIVWLLTCGCWSLPFGPYFYFNPPHMSGVLDHRGQINNIGLFDMQAAAGGNGGGGGRQHDAPPILLNYDNNPRSLALQRRASSSLSSSPSSSRQNDLFQSVWFAPYYNRPLYEELRDMEHQEDEKRRRR